MKKYDYFAAVCEDVKNYINENGIEVTSENREDIESRLYDECFVADSVTGNASGSYTFSTWEAEENLCNNLNLFREACKEFGSDAAQLIEEDAEACDVTIRCYLLSQAISAVLDELEEEGEWE